MTNVVTRNPYLNNPTAEAEAAGVKSRKMWCNVQLLSRPPGAQTPALLRLLPGRPARKLQREQKQTPDDKASAAADASRQQRPNQQKKQVTQLRKAGNQNAWSIPGFTYGRDGRKE